MNPNTKQPEKIVHQYRDVDVLSTKTILNRVHPGNRFYRDLIAKYSTKRISHERQQIVTNKIIDIICHDRQGHFLKDAHGHYTVMDRDGCYNKVLLAIKNGQSKLHTGVSKQKKKKKFTKQAVTSSAIPFSPIEATSSSGGTVEPPAQTTEMSASTVKSDSAVATRKRKAPASDEAKKPPPSVIYQAQKGSKEIHPYALQIMTQVSNTEEPQEALRLLDESLKKTKEERQERLMRLQLRHRYYAAWNAGMTPRDFSEKLLEFWDGHLVKTMVSNNELNLPKQNIPVDSMKPEQNDSVQEKTGAAPWEQLVPKNEF